MALTPAPVVPAPAPRGLRYGLLTAAAGPLDLPARRGSGAGVRYEPVTCGTAHTYPIECDDTPPPKTFDGADDYVDAEPFVVYSTYSCGTVGKTPADIEAKVRTRLANGEQTAAEEGMADVLAAGAVAIGSSDMTSLTAVVAELEQWLYGVHGYGNVGYLHAPARVAAYAQNEGGLAVVNRLTPGVLTTLMGTVWIFGGGYPDDGTIYISGHTTVWRSPDVFVPDVLQTLDRAANQWYAIAEREYAVAYDCLAASTPFTPEAFS